MSRPDPVNLANGRETYEAEPDITAYNPGGPGVSYQRTFYTGTAEQGYGSPGLPPGWLDNFDYSIQTHEQTTFKLLDPRGAVEVLTPVTSAGAYTGAFVRNPGDPFTVSGTPPSTSGSAWQDITVTFSSGVRWTFAPTPANMGNLYLYKITDVFNHSIYINRTADARVQSVTDAPLPGASALLSFEYSTAGGAPGYLSAIQEASGRRVLYSYMADPSSGVIELRSVSQPNSTAMRWQYDYASVGQKPHLSGISMQSPTGTGLSTANIYYDGSGRVAALVDANDNLRLYTYAPQDFSDTSGGKRPLATKVSVYGPRTDPQQPRNGTNSRTLTDWWFQTFDANGRDTGRQDQDGRGETIEYEAGCDCALVKTFTDRNGRRTSYDYDSEKRVLQVEGPYPADDPRNVVTTYGWQSPAGLPFGRLHTVTVSGRSVPTTYTYDVNNPFLVTGVSGPAPAGSGVSAVSASFTYSPLGNLTQITGPANNATTHVTTTLNYTADGTFTQTEKRGQPLSVSVGGTSQVAHYRYTTDGRGNVASVWAGSEGATDFHYNDADQADIITYPHTGDTGTGRAHTNLTYLYPGGPLIQTDDYDENPGNPTPVRTMRTLYGPEGEMRARVGDTELAAFRYDPLYRVKAVADAHGLTVNVDGTVTMSTDQNLLTTYTYDDANQTWSTRTPLGNVTQYAHTYQARTEGGVTYQDSVITRTNALTPTATVTTFTFAGPANQLTDITYSDSTPQVQFTYDNYGRRWTMSDGQGTTTYGYDDQDNVTSSSTQYTGLPARTTAYAYYPDGSRKTMTVPGYTQPFSYAYNAAGQLTQLSNPLAELTTWTYNSAGRLTGQDSGAGSTGYGYNPAGLVNSLTTVGWDTAIWLDYTQVQRDALGRLKYLDYFSEVADETNFQFDVWRQGWLGFTYDGKGQLKGETGTPFTAGFLYEYDAAGNRISDQEFTYTPVTTDYDRQNQRDSPDAYDANGNPTTYRGFSGFEYDAENRLTQLSSGSSILFEAGYNGDGLRAWKKGSGTGDPERYFLYDTNGLPLAELDQNGNTTALNTFGANGISSRWDTALGSVSYRTDLSGNVIEQMETGQYNWLREDLYGPYGTVALADGTASGPFRFSGQWGGYQDVETGLVLMGFRYYDPASGRFLTKDPIGFAGGINQYAYAGNDPVNFLDPLGLASWRDNVSVFWDFLRGNGTATRNYDQGSSFTQDMMWSQGANRMRQEVKAGATRGASGHFPPWWESASQLGYNPTQSTVGGFTWTAQRHCGLVTYTIRNDMSWRSLALQLPWEPRKERGQWSFSPTLFVFGMVTPLGPRLGLLPPNVGGTIHQTFQWTEVAP